MFIPTGDIPNPRAFRPWVNWMLMGLNIAIFVCITLPLSQIPADPRSPQFREYVEVIDKERGQEVSIRGIAERLTAYDLYVFDNGFKPGAPEWMDLLYAMFLHANLAHLAGNMLFLWIFGDNVEHRLGRLTYFFAYLGTGAAATVFFTLFSWGSMIPMVGASGAISGVLGLYFLLFPRSQVKVFILLFPIFMNVVLLPARFVLGLYLVVDNLLPFLIGVSSGVARGAHIGGFFAGLALAYYGERLSWKWPWSGDIDAHRNRRRLR